MQVDTDAEIKGLGETYAGVYVPELAAQIGETKFAVGRELKPFRPARVHGVAHSVFAGVVR